MSSATFVAIDFETADYGRDSACAVGLVRVEGQRIVDEVRFLIRPPRRDFVFTFIHNIAWADVENQPTFRTIWLKTRPLLRGAEYMVAHNFGFDRAVLEACCERARLRPPDLGYRCTMKLARCAWGIFPTKLPDVCRSLGIPLDHHDPLSDARACAHIVIRAKQEGLGF
jgi:DNA polymerase-3 subunit epsilon